jgi:hypothetical protein
MPKYILALWDFWKIEGMCLLDTVKVEAEKEKNRVGFI